MAQNYYASGISSPVPENLPLPKFPEIPYNADYLNYLYSGICQFGLKFQARILTPEDYQNYLALAYHFYDTLGKMGASTEVQLPIPINLAPQINLAAATTVSQPEPMPLAPELTPRLTVRQRAERAGKPWPNQSWTMLQVARQCPPETWEPVMQAADPELSHISRQIDIPGSKYYPQKEDLFMAFWKTPLPTVKVVIFGQDPYPGFSHVHHLPVATGMAFSTRVGDRIAESVSNMFKELQNTVKGFRYPSHGDLSRWAEQGVLLLNTCLHFNPGFRQQGKRKLDETWFPFLERVMSAIQAANNKIVFLLLGKDAKEMERMISRRSFIVSAAHPSPLSARLFFGCDCFNKVNQKLRESGQQEIDWNVE